MDAAATPRLPREHLVNAEFDLSLRAHWPGPNRRRLALQIRDLAQMFWLAGGPEDTLLVEDEPPDEFLDYLARKGLRHLTPAVWPGIDPGRLLVPFGWNRRAEEVASRYRQMPPHPALDVVREINSRRFSAAIERELFPGPGVSAALESPAALEEFLGQHPAPPGGWLLKASHANAGLGQLRTHGPLSARLARTAAALLAEDGCLLIEPWRKRDVDFSLTFQLNPQGGMDSPAVHEVINTAGGSFLGSLLGDASPAVERWGPEILEAARPVAQRMADAGYFGPAGIDAFTYHHDGELRLRPLVEINARVCMSVTARALHRDWESDGAIYLRLSASDSFPFDGSIPRFEKLLGDRNFDGDTRRGVLLTSPLSLGSGDQRRQPHRFSVLFAGKTRQEVLAMDRAFRDEFQR